MSQDPDDPSTSASSPNFETIFTDAFKEYKKRTKKDIAAHSLAAQIESCDSPKAVLTVLQTQVQTFDPSPSANETWTRLLDPTITVLYAFSGFVSNVTGPVFPPAAAIFTGIGVLLQAVKDVRATQDTLVDLFRRIQFFFMRLEKYIAVRPTAAMMAVIVEIMVEVILILGITTKEMKEGRIKKFSKRLFGINRLNDAFQHLDRLTQEEALMAEAETLVIAARIEESVIHVSENVEGINEGVQGVRVTMAGMKDKLESAHTDVQGIHREVTLMNTGVTEAKEDINVVLKHVSDLNRNESRKDLRQWIDPPDPSSNFYTASDSHHEGTATWCTEGKAFDDWMTSGSLLWIHGKPGSGKTILSSVIVQHFESMSNSGAVFLAYFYFDFKDEGKKDSRALLSSLLDQISNQSDQFRDVLRRLYLKHQDGSKQPHNDALLRCLKDMLTMARSVPVYLVMDALDECPNDSGDLSSRTPRGKVLSLVGELVKLRLPNLRLCITSRPELDIRAIIKPLATQEISLHDESGQNRDINAYVTFVVQSVKNWRDDDKKMVIDKLTEDADGMFRWVYCQLEALRPCFPNNLRRMLKELPKSLDETYQRILKEINNANQKQAHQLLQCLAVAHRPLRVEELAEVLALDVDAGGIPTLNANWRWEDHEAAVLSACSSLVSVIVDDDFWVVHKVVQFSHFSVKEFLTSDRLASMEDVSQFHIADEPSHTILAQACLGVILSMDDRTSDDRTSNDRTFDDRTPNDRTSDDCTFNDRTSDCTSNDHTSNDRTPDDRTPEDSVEYTALLPYADEYWFKHAQIGKVELRIEDALDCLFDLEKPYFGAFLRRTGVDREFRPLRAPSDEEPTGVLTPVTPFLFAGINRLSGLAERLIVLNQPHVLGFRLQGWTLLHWAVHYEHIEVARLLLAYGADINSRRDDATPPHIAYLQSHIERPVDGSLEEIDEIENSSWIGKASVSSEEITSFDRDDLKEKSGFTPLHIAISDSTLDMCQMLLEHKADVRARDNKGNTPLHLASSSDDHLEISRMLLEYNVEVNSRNEDGSTPLLIASSNRNIDISQLLLAHNADTFVHDNRGNTPLHVAVIRGRLEVARMLLEHKASVNALNKEGSTPLNHAIKGWQRLGQRAFVRLLLNHGADVTVLVKDLKVHNNSGNTLLHFAASEGDLELARMFLEHNAEEINSQNDDGSTAFLLALKRRNTDVARLLLDHNADVHMHTCSNTPLHVAVCHGQLDVCRIILERNVGVNSQDDHGSTPLLIASQYGPPDLVQLLLEHNADLGLRDSDGDTPLHCAVIGGQLEVVRLLLKLNVDINSRNEKGSTPLHLASAGFWEGNPDMVRLLLDHGADTQARNISGETASEVARGEKRQEIVQLLSDRAAE